MAKTLKHGIVFLLENSLFLVGGTVVALIWVNFFDVSSYNKIAHGPLHFAINDIGMALFFLLAGKEIREAMLPGGDLSDRKTAALPVMATIGGMAGPGLLFYFGAMHFNPDLARGWAIPMATDIAFSYMVAKMIFGRSVNGKMPAPIIFLLLLAIADDAGGLIVLAIFYPTGDQNMLLFAALSLGAIALALVLWKIFKVKHFMVYVVGPGLISWIGFYKGGIHPALALVPLAWCMPHEHTDMGIWAPGESNKKDTLNRMEHAFKYPVEIILGLFGFVNAGVVLGSMGTGTWLVLAGLLIGKPLGIMIMSGLGLLGPLKLPNGMDLKDLFVVSMAAAIGFTVALFVSVVAFKPGSLQDSVKMGALLSFAAFGLTFLMAILLGVRRKWQARQDPI